MKKMILLLLLLSHVIFGYEITRIGLYSFENHELRDLFGPNYACQMSAWIIFNEGRIKYSLKGTPYYSKAFEAVEKAIEVINSNVIIEEEEWYKHKDSYRNLSTFYTRNCPKTLRRIAKAMLPKEDYKILGKLNMTKYFKGEKTDKMDRYGNYYKKQCIDYETTIDDRIIVNRECVDVRVPDN